MYKPLINKTTKPKTPKSITLSEVEINSLYEDLILQSSEIKQREISEYKTAVLSKELKSAELRSKFKTLLKFDPKSVGLRLPVSVQVTQNLRGVSLRATENPGS